MPGDPDDIHSRYIEAAVNGLIVGCLYLPNGNPALIVLMISIIIPTLNEEQALPPLLDAIRRQGADHEVIVADGGSEDRTVAIALDHGVRTLFSPPGRGNGMCAGAKKATGDVLLFLHADSILL